MNLIEKFSIRNKIQTPLIIKTNKIINNYDNLFSDFEEKKVKLDVKQKLISDEFYKELCCKKK